jgi:hypothetical protein
MTNRGLVGDLAEQSYRVFSVDLIRIMRKLGKIAPPDPLLKTPFIVIINSNLIGFILKEI